MMISGKVPSSIEPGLWLRAICLRKLLLERALFDEAHWVEKALDSPTLCDGEYAASSLREAGIAARNWGLAEVASWLEGLTGANRSHVQALPNIRTARRTVLKKEPVAALCG